MRLGISTACFYPQPLEEILPVLAGLGVHAVEVFFNTESEFSSTFTADLAAEARRCGLDIVSVHPYTSLMEGMMLFSDYQRRTEDGMQQYRRYFEAAAELGARFLTFHGERDMGRADDEARFQRKCEQYHKLCALAAAYGVTLAQENVAWCRSNDPAFVRALYENVPELRYTLDIKQAFRAGRDWREFVDVMGDRLVNVHINDFGHSQSCLLPGAGEMDYADFFHRLRSLGYNGHTLIEVYRSNFTTVDEMARAVAHLRHFVPV